VAMGVLKWFKPDKGYGFIRPEDGGQDVFVHISAVQKAGYTSLAEGARVSYELVAGRSGKLSAENLALGDARHIGENRIVLWSARLRNPTTDSTT
jgi:cold shock protein